MTDIDLTSLVEAVAKDLWEQSNGEGSWKFTPHLTTHHIRESVLPVVTATVKHLGTILPTETRQVPVQVDHEAPDYSCRPCRDGDHAACREKEVYGDWSHDCVCRSEVPHFRTVTVAVLEVPDDTT